MNQIITVPKNKRLVFISDEKTAYKVVSAEDIDIQNCIVVINGELISKQKTSTKLNKIISMACMQLRKRNIEVIIITNKPIDRRVVFYTMGEQEI